jgi:protein-L-isoaspartate(D-aspartate) O-methyltransferase
LLGRTSRKSYIGEDVNCIAISSTCFFILGCASGLFELSPVEEQEARSSMVARQLASRDIEHPRVLEVMGQVPRHLFVPESMRAFAYQDSPLPIGLNQTISQPYIVALMTQLAQPFENMKALEIGTGSGYQAAVLSRLVKEVYTVEIIPELADRAKSTLNECGYENVFIRQGDGYQGWPENGPFDIVLVTAAAETIPEPLIDQLAEGGRLIMPVGEVGGIQVLTRLTKKDGKIREERVLGVRFVPLTGQALEQ